MVNHIKGNVKGLPTTVPIIAAIRFPLIKKANIKAKTKWKPINGVNETIEPQAKPAEIEYIDASSLLNLKK